MQLHIWVIASGHLFQIICGKFSQSRSSHDTQSPLSVPRPPSGWRRPETPQQAPFDVKEQQLYSQMTKLLTPSLRESPTPLWRKLTIHHYRCVHQSTRTSARSTNPKVVSHRRIDPFSFFSSSLAGPTDVRPWASPQAWLQIRIPVAMSHAGYAGTLIFLGIGVI